ncbi:DUF732 domain-containing protein [Mycobacterium botniense]|uniref:DUF732 domain-containing protein n=1 Tax=Mycobacterium botniense TaxID=84962 RepID=UPI001FE3C9DC|nr:DUF732 domain-containing protein [Mycobacterium botniense]
MAGLVAVAGLAVPAHADPAEDDANFLAMLKNAGITYNNAGRAVTAGRTVCQLINSGTAPADVVTQLTNANPGFKTENALTFTGIAARVYCPGRLKDSGG